MRVMEVASADASMDAGEAAGQQPAPQACRKQKRRCDKQLPACSLCSRIGRPCDYTPEASALPPTPEDFAALRQQVSNLQHLLQASGLPGQRGDDNKIAGKGSDGQAHSNGSNGRSHSNDGSPPDLLSLDFASGGMSNWSGTPPFPAIYFIDSTAFEYERFNIPAPFVKVPPGALSALGSSAELRAMIEFYFVTVHLYFPIVSKIRLYQHLSNPLHEPGADIALLFLAMKLMTDELPEGAMPQTQLYQDVKSFFAYTEAQNGFSIQMMQALQLITMYEIGNAIYPAAYLTAGHAARLGHAMGLHNRNAPQMLPRCTTWTEQEERRRVWWGVLVLEVYVNTGHRGKPLATPEPGLETYLPIDESLWDKGQMEAAAPLSLSASPTIRASPFARTCQASHLLGKVNRHLAESAIPVDFRFKEASQLNRTIRAFSALLPDEAQGDDPMKPTLCTAMALCYSAVLTLYDSYSCTDRFVDSGPEEQLVVQKESIDGLPAVSDMAYQLSVRIKTFIDAGGLCCVSPLVIDAVYQAAANYAWMFRESSNPDFKARLTELKEILMLLDKRWKSAGAYLFTLTDFWERSAYT